MKDHIESRVITVANEFVSTEKTIREIAKMYGVSKTTVHQDLTTRLLKIDKGLAIKVMTVIEKHKEESTKRGGMATKRKYEKSKLETL